MSLPKNQDGNVRPGLARNAFPLLSHMEISMMIFFSDLLWYRKCGYGWRASAVMAKNTIHMPVPKPLSLPRYGLFNNDRARHRQKDRHAIQ